MCIIHHFVQNSKPQRRFCTAVLPQNRPLAPHFLYGLTDLVGCENKMDDGGSKPPPYDDFIFPIFVGLDAHIEPPEEF